MKLQFFPICLAAASLLLSTPALADGFQDLDAIVQADEDFGDDELDDILGDTSSDKPDESGN